jgi:hypothetical protein
VQDWFIGLICFFDFAQAAVNRLTGRPCPSLGDSLEYRLVELFWVSLSQISNGGSRLWHSSQPF